MPPTFILQSVAAVVLAATGVAALAAVRGSGGFPERFRLTWRITGLTFLAIGVSALLQNVHGGRALLGGEGSAAWNGYLRWAPAWNHSREGIPFALALLLAGCALAPARLRLHHPWTAPLVLGATVALGMLAGWAEGPLSFGTHYTRVAVIDAVALLFVISALAAAMVADVVDRLLIATVVAHAIPLPLNALWFSWMVEYRDAGWSPSPFSMQLYRVTFDLLCVALAVRRWRLARRGAYVPGLLATPPRPLIG